MLQQLTITTNSDVSLRPLVESAIQNEVKLLTLGLQRTLERLSDFERRFSMSSADFERRFAARELPESLEFIEWSGEIKTLQLLEDQRRALQGAQVQ